MVVEREARDRTHTFGRDGSVLDADDEVVERVLLAANRLHPAWATRKLVACRYSIGFT